MSRVDGSDGDAKMSLRIPMRRPPSNVSVFLIAIPRPRVGNQRKHLNRRALAHSNRSCVCSPERKSRTCVMLAVRPVVKLPSRQIRDSSFVSNNVVPQKRYTGQQLPLGNAPGRRRYKKVNGHFGRSTFRRTSASGYRLFACSRICSIFQVS